MSSNSSSNNNDDDSQISNFIARLHAQHIQIEPSQAQFLLDATGGDADMALALYWEDSVANAARDHGERQRQRQQQQQQQQHDNGNDNDQNPRERERGGGIGGGAARERPIGNEPAVPPPPAARDRERRAVHRRERRDRARLRNFLRNHERFGEERRELDRGGEMNREREREEEVAILRNNNHRRQDVVVEANNHLAQRNAMDPDNHVSISDDEHNFNERFLRRIKDHMKRRKSKGLHNNQWAMDSKKRKLIQQNTGKFRSSLADDINALMNNDEEENKANKNSNRAGDADEVLRSLMRISKGVNDGKDMMDTVDKRHDMGYGVKPTSTGTSTGTGTGNVNDDVSDDEEDDELDAKYAEALNLLDSAAGMPSLLLWGNGNHVQDDNADSTAGVSSKNQQYRSEPIEVHGQGHNNQNGGGGGGGGGNGNGDNSGNHDDNAESPNHHVEIPRTWLAAGFILSSCGTGLVLPVPDETDVARLKSIQSKLFPPGSGISLSSAPLPPFNCGGITLLTSIVTALLYSGISTHGKDICFHTRTPFGQLSRTEKKQQFPSRLADVLSAILIVASEASVKYRLDLLNDITKKIELYRDLYRDDEDSDDDEVHDKTREATIKRVMKTRATLCPVCRWDDTGNNRDVSLLDRGILKMQVSFTNRHDIKAYVVANIHSFMSPGGCALFLETIFHIHGRPRIQKLLDALLKNNNGQKKKCLPFVKCECESKLKQEWESFLTEKKINPLFRLKDGTNPVCNSCVGVELMSLLLTGKPHAEMTGWCADKFGIGFLSGNIDDEDVMIDEQLKLPSKPVWIAKGPTSYFVIWNGDDQVDVRNLGQSSYSFNLSTWNCWDDMQVKDTYRIMPKCRTRKDSLSVDYNNANNNNNNNNNPITKADLEQVKIHPDDKLTYFNDYRRWRYSFAHDYSKNKVSYDDNTAPAWIPFSRLNDRQKAIIQKKHAKSIELAIWTLWPNVSIQEIVQDDEIV